jgi:hypothetical protein
MSGKAHVLVLVVTLATLFFIGFLLRRRQLRAKYALLWGFLGAGLLVLAAVPRLLDTISLWLGIAYGPATFFLAAIVLLFLVVIHFSWELSRLEERTRRLAEELALRDVGVAIGLGPTENVGVGGAPAGSQAPALGEGSAQVSGEAGQRP